MCATHTYYMYILYAGFHTEGAGPISSKLRMRDKYPIIDTVHDVIFYSEIEG